MPVWRGPALSEVEGALARESPRPRPSSRASLRSDRVARALLPASFPEGDRREGPEFSRAEKVPNLPGFSRWSPSLETTVESPSKSEAWGSRRETDRQDSYFYPGRITFLSVQCGHRSSKQMQKVHTNAPHLTHVKPLPRSAPPQKSQSAESIYKSP